MIDGHIVFSIPLAIIREHHRDVLDLFHDYGLVVYRAEYKVATCAIEYEAGTAFEVKEPIPLTRYQLVSCARSLTLEPEVSAESRELAEALRKAQILTQKLRFAENEQARLQRKLDAISDQIRA